MRVILDEDIAADRALERMCDVVDNEVIAVAPAGHLKVLKRIEVVFPEGFVPQEMARVVVISNPEAVLN
jgi:hypothetical protein